MAAVVVVFFRKFMYADTTGDWNRCDQAVMRDLKISFLGSLAITVNEKPIEVASNYVRALFIFLVIEKQHPHRREALAEMFWPDKPEGVARNSLKQALSNLRSALGERTARSPFLLVSRDEIQFNQSSPSWVDVEEFGELVEDCADHHHEDEFTCPTCENWLLRAADLYQGDFLADFYLPDNQDFNDWIILRREAYQRQMSDVLCHLAQILEARGEFSEASDYCRQLVDLEPWNEGNHRNLMRLLALNGMRSAALRQYQICREDLRKELDVEPSNATVNLYKEIKTWKAESFPGHNSPAELARKSDDLILPLEDASNLLAPSRKLSRYSAFALIIAALILGIGSVSWLGASQTPLSAIALEEDEASLVIPATAISTPRPSQTVSSPTSTEASEPAAAFISISSPTPDLEDQIQALEALYEQTDGPNWENNAGWFSGLSPCEWYGITCRGEKIIELELSNNQLKGNIPPEIGSLSNLEYLVLSGNSELMGPIPPELGRLSNLLHLELASEEVGSLLSGPIPKELGNLLNLEVLVIQNSLLSGPLPREIFGLIKLKVLNLGNNQLSGTIDPEIGNLVDLEFLDLGGNAYMSGSIPPEIGKLIRLQYLYLGDSNLSGNLPPEIGNLSRLRILQIDGNLLFGPLPETLTNLHNQLFWFDRTNLCEPADEAFQAWLRQISDLQSSQIVCAPQYN